MSRKDRNDLITSEVKRSQVTARTNTLFWAVRRSCDTDRRPPLMRAWDGVTAWERGERQSDSQWRQGGSFWISPRVLTGDHTHNCTDTCDGQILNQMSGVGLRQNF